MVDHLQHLVLSRRNQEQERELAANRLEALRSRTTREIQNLVHDLQSPLASVATLLNTLALKLTEDEFRPYLVRAEHTVHSMSTMISEILESDVRRSLPGDDMLMYLKAQLPDENVRLSIRRALPPVKVNLVRITRAMVNIVQNGLEAGSENDVQVIIRAGVVRDRLRIRIRDYGSGIETDTWARIDEVGFSTKGSSGLGLPFARSIIEKEHEGVVRLYSGEGVGTLVRIELPVSRECVDREGLNLVWPRPVDVTQIHRPTSDVRKPRLLVVDDDPGILLAFEAIAADAEWKITACLDGRLALEQWRLGMYDIAIVDYHMPSQDGLLTLRAMRKTDEHTPILIMTVDDSQHIATRFLREGANDFVLKPIKALDLMARLRVHLRHSTTSNISSIEVFSKLLEEKGVQPYTLELVVSTMQQTREFLTAVEVAERSGIAISTAYRYLAALESHGFLESRLLYGETGRPRKTIRLAEAPVVSRSVSP